MTKTLASSSLAAHEPLRRDLAKWLAKARLTGLDEEGIEALFTSTFRSRRPGNGMTAILSARGLGTTCRRK